MTNFESLLKIIANYSGPVLLLFSVPIYFVKRHYDWKTKKAEAKNSVFQQQKLSAIVNFISAYTAYERINWDLISHRILDEKVTADELDKMIEPLKDRLTESFYVLHLFLNSNDLNDFKLIHSNALQIDTPLKRLMFDGQEEKRMAILGKFQLHKDVIIDHNNQKLKDIGTKYRSE